MSEKLYLKYFPFIESEDDYYKLLIAIEQLKDEKDRFVVKSYLGLDSEMLTQMEIAKCLGCTPGRINQRFKRIVMTISTALIGEVDLNSIDIDYLHTCIEKLPNSTDREIISMYLGLNGKKYSQERIGRKFNMTQANVSVRINQIKFQLNKIINDKEYVKKVVNTTSQGSLNQEYYDRLTHIIASIDDYTDKEIALKSFGINGEKVSFHGLSKQLGISYEEVERRYKQITESINQQLIPYMHGNKNFQRHFPQCHTKTAFDDIMNKIFQIDNDKAKEIAIVYFTSQPPMTLEEIGHKYLITRQAVFKSIEKTLAFVKDVRRTDYQERIDKYFKGIDISIIKNAITHLANCEEQEIAMLYFGLDNDQNYVRKTTVTDVDISLTNFDKSLERIVLKMQFFIQTGIMLSNNLLKNFPDIIKYNTYFQFISFVSHMANDNYRHAVIFYFGLIDGKTKTVDEIAQIIQNSPEHITNFIRNFVATVNKKMANAYEPLDEDSKDFRNRIGQLSKNEVFNRLIDLMSYHDAIILFLALDLDRCGHCTDRLIADTLHLSVSEVKLRLKIALKIYKRYLLESMNKNDQQNTVKR